MKRRLILLLSLLCLSGEAEELPYTKKVKLAWDEVERSQGYELEIYKGELLFHKEITTQLSWETRLEPSLYKYRVRALDEFGRFGNWTSFEEFHIKPKEILLADSSKASKKTKLSHVDFAVAYGFYDYRSEAGGFGFGKANGASEFAVEGDLNYWVLSRLGLGLGVSYTSSELSGISLSYPDMNMSLRYLLFSDSSFYFNPLLSIEYQNTPEFMATGTSPSSLKGNLITTIGIALGAEFGFQISNIWALSAWFRYISPVSFSGSNVQNGVADASTFYKYGFGISYAFKPRWDAILEYTSDYHKASYETQNNRTNLYKNSSRVGLGLRVLFGDAK